MSSPEEKREADTDWQTDVSKYGKEKRRNRSTRKKRKITPKRVEDKLGFLTGGARGQGRSHAIRLAQEGADIIVVDVAEETPNVCRFYRGVSDADLAETVSAVESLDRRIVASKVDVRNFDALKAALDDGVSELGHVDILSANAGIFLFGEPTHQVSGGDWADVIDSTLTGVWHTVKEVVAHLIGQGTGGSIILTSSTAGLKIDAGYTIK